MGTCPSIRAVERVEVRGLEISFERAGSGPPVVLLHGGLSDHREWRAQLDDLSDAFTVIAWDAPGCGGSADPPVDFGMTDYADVLAGFIASLGVERPHIVGLSWGSTLALELYRRDPRIPQTLILIAAYAGWAGSLAPDEVAERLEGVLHGLSQRPEDHVRSWLPSLVTERASPEVRETLLRIMSAYHPAGARVMVHAMAGSDLRDVLPRIEVPTLLLYGAEDERSPRAVAEEMHARIPRSTLAYLPAVGHQCNMEAPAACNGALRGFLASEGSPPLDR